MNPSRSQRAFVCWAVVLEVALVFEDGDRARQRSPSLRKLV